MKKKRSIILISILIIVSVTIYFTNHNTTKTIPINLESLSQWGIKIKVIFYIIMTNFKNRTKEVEDRKHCESV